MTLSEPVHADNRMTDGGTSPASGLSEALATSTGQDIVVAVIDTGIDPAHPDLVSNLWTNPGEIPNNNLDDDGNGYIDDYHGYDFANDDGDPTDDNGHGTHVAGIIAADDNDFGAVGVAPDAKIMALKTLDAESQGSTFDATQAVEYAVLMGADIINASWGGGAYSQDLSDAIAAAADAGVLFVAAAGNAGTNNDIEPQYPASYDLDNVISVGASTASGQLASFSNYGPTSVDLVAPGDQIYSTLPNGSYGTMSGTSMAAPYVAGTAALLLEADPTLSPKGLKTTILESADPSPGLTGVVASGGELNTSQALTAYGGASIKTSASDRLIGDQGLSVVPSGAVDDLTHHGARAATSAASSDPRQRSDELLWDVAALTPTSHPIAQISSLPVVSPGAIAQTTSPESLDFLSAEDNRCAPSWVHQASLQGRLV